MEIVKKHAKDTFRGSEKDKKEMGGKKEKGRMRNRMIAKY